MGRCAILNGRASRTSYSGRDTKIMPELRVTYSAATVPAPVAAALRAGA